MAEPARLHPRDLRGLLRLGTDAVGGITGIVEGMHRNIAAVPAPWGAEPQGGAAGIAGLVYGAVRGTSGLVGTGLDFLLKQVEPLAGEPTSSAQRDKMISALNGVLGDHLETTGNPLALSMTLRSGGKELPLDRTSLAAALPEAGGRVLVMVHGLCMSDHGWNWNDHDHGAELAGDLGYTPVYFRYNTGRHISLNGEDMASRLERLIAEWPVPVEDLTIVGHSMGGLVARSAHLYGTEAGHDWPDALASLVFLGTPHHGAPLERGGSWLDSIIGFSPYTAPLARLGMVRSAGITDLRHGSVTHEDWEGRDRFARGHKPSRTHPLPESVACYSIASTTGERVGDVKSALLGDGLVPLASALGRHRNPDRHLDFPEERTWIGTGLGHLDLLGDAGVYQQLRDWLER